MADRSPGGAAVTPAALARVAFLVRADRDASAGAEADFELAATIAGSISPQQIADVVELHRVEPEFALERLAAVAAERIVRRRHGGDVRPRYRADGHGSHDRGRYRVEGTAPAVALGLPGTRRAL